MTGLIETHRRLKSDQVSTIVHAAVIAWGFVFLHPFGDGNGRIHRFLVHNILALRGILTPGLMFPVSAVMLKDPVAYDASLEAFSRPLLQRVVDMPDRLIDLFIQLCLQNNGKLAKGKRSAHFAFLSEEELKAMETAVRKSYSLYPPSARLALAVARIDWSSQKGIIMPHSGLIIPEKALRPVMS